MSNTIKVRRGTLANLPALNAGEIGFTTDTHQLYIGDGTTNYLIGPNAAGSGDVSGPSSATDSHLAVFNGTTGKIIKDGGAIPAAGLPITGGTMTGALIPADHGTSTNPEVVAVIYGTGDPPDPDDYPNGTVFIKYSL